MQLMHNTILLSVLFIATANAAEIDDNETDPLTEQIEESIHLIINGDEEAPHKCCEHKNIIDVDETPKLVILQKFFQGGNILSSLIYVIGSGYYPIAYLAQLGCKIASDPWLRGLSSLSPWRFQDCEILSPCDSKLASPTLCTIDQVGTIAGYANIATAVCFCGVVGYQIYQNHQRNNHASTDLY